MTNWAQYRPNNTKFTPKDIDPFLCTHVIYAFAAINTTNYEIRSVEWNDETAEKKGSNNMNENLFQKVYQRVFFSII